MLGLIKHRWLGASAVAVSCLLGGQVASANLLLNPGFELPAISAGDQIGGAQDWTVTGAVFTNKNIAPTATPEPHSGLQVAKLLNGAAIAQTFAANPGEEYLAGIYATSSGADALGSGSGTLALTFLDSGSATIGSPITALLSPPTGVNNRDPNAYVFDDVTGIAPASTAFVRFSFSFTGSGGLIADDASLTMVPVPEPASVALMTLGGLMMLRRKRA